MKTFLSLAVLLSGVSCVLAQPSVSPSTSTTPLSPAAAKAKLQEDWAKAIESNDVAAAQKLVKLPGFDPLLSLPSLSGTILSESLSRNRAKIAEMVIIAAPNEAYLRGEAGDLYELGRPENFSVLKRLAQKPGFDPNFTIRKAPLLEMVAVRSNFEGTKLLLKNPKIKPMARDDSGQTVLHEACAQESVPLLSLLLSDKRIDPNAVDEDGNSPLHNAARNLNVAAVKRLLADPRVNANLKNKAGQSALFVAATGDIDTVNAFLSSKQVKVGPKEKAQIALLKKAGGHFGSDAG